DGVAVNPADGREELPRGVVGGQRGLQVTGDLDGGLPGVGPVPAAVGPGPLDLPQTRGPHPARGDQGLGLVSVDLGPAAAGAAGREPLPPEMRVNGALLPVDPAEADGDLQGL